jgi:hypothetical protein
VGCYAITIEKPRDLAGRLVAREVEAGPRHAKADALLTTMIAGDHKLATVTCAYAPKRQRDEGPEQQSTPFPLFT